MEQRTSQQNKAMHTFFTLVAEALNEAGLDMKAVLKPGVDIPWSSQTVKDYLWRPVQEIYMGKHSTTELTTKDVNKIWEVLNRHLGEKGIHVAFPSWQRDGE